MLPKDVATFEANQVNLKGMHKQQMEISVEELIQSPANLNTRAEVDNYGANLILPTIFRTGSLEENLCPSKATQQERPFQDFYRFENEKKFQLYEAGQIWAISYRAKVHHNFRYARIDSTSKAATCVSWLKPIPVTSSERRWCDAGLPVACGSFEVNSDMQMSIESRWPKIAYHKCAWLHGMTKEQFEIYPKSGEMWAVYKDWDLDEWSHNPDYVIECKFELVEVLSDFSKYLGTHAACLVKLKGFTSIFERQIIGGNPVTFHIPPNNLYIFSHRILAHKIQGVEGMFELDQLALPDYMIQDASTQKTQSWSQKDFVAGQVWAVYWGNDFMPRKYVKINNVVSEEKVSVTFLEPLPVLHHEIEWIRQDLPMVCGTFIGGERNANIEISLFSHLVKCGQGPSKSCYKIYPLKGEIWAMYKSWNAKWKMASFENSRCQIVHILSDFSEGDEITISELGAVKGCLTFFSEQQYDGFDLIHGVSRADILRFSHRIPAFKVPGIGKYGIPDDAWHLEPLTLPIKISK